MFYAHFHGFKDCKIDALELNYHGNLYGNHNTTPEESALQNRSPIHFIITTRNT